MTSATFRTFAARWGWLVGVAVVVSVGAALVVTLLRTPIYEATAEVAPAPTLELSADAMETERLVAGSDLVRERVRDDLGLLALPPRPATRVTGGSNVLSIGVRHDDRAAARRLADATAAAYVAVRDGVPVVINPASEPREPVHPNAARSVGLAALLGLVVGGAGAVTAFRNDDTVRSSTDLADVDGLDGIEVLATIDTEPPPDNRPITISLPECEAVEDFRSIAVLLRGRSRSPGDQLSVLVTSAGRREGRTTVAANLAVTTARSGARTLLIDANVRIPRLHDAFGVERGPGFADVLVGKVESVDPYLLDVGAGMALELVAAGSVDPAAVDMMAGPAASAAVRRLSVGYDVVVVDSSSARVLPDPLSVVAAVDEVVLVVGLGRVDRTDVALTASRFRRAGASVAGIVCNGVPRRR